MLNQVTAAARCLMDRSRREVTEFLEIDGGNDVRTLVALVTTVGILARWSGAEAGDGRETYTSEDS